MKQVIQLQLVEAACDGDTDAIETLLHQCQPSMIHIARKYCATAEDVEDAVQLTLWAIYQKVETLKNAKAFISWAFTIVRHHCYRLLAEHTRLDKIQTSKFQELQYKHDEELYIALKQDLVTAIQHLPSSHREVLILRDVEGFTSPEVAEKLGLSLATVKSRLHRARNILRENLKHWVS